MNDLLQSKKLLENKIALTKGNIGRKKKEFERLQKEAEETNEIIVTLHQELWKDEFALEAVNEEISRIPTLNCSRDKLFKTIKETAVIALIFCLPLFCLPLFCQAKDTIPAKKVLVCNQIINAKNGKIMHRWWRKVNVKSGYIIKEANGLYVINGKEMKPDNYSDSLIVIK